MQAPPFVTIRCPSCSSADVRTLELGRFACRHCQTNFLFTGPSVTPVNYVRRPQSSGGALIVIVAVVMLVFGGAVLSFFFAARSAGLSPESPPAAVAQRPVAVSPPRAVPVVTPAMTRAPTPSATPSATPTPSTPTDDAKPEGPPQLSDYQALEGCACNKPTARLHVRANGSSTTISNNGMTVTRHLEFVVVGSDGIPWRVPATESSAPATGYDKGDISMGVGCKDDTLVVAAGMQVSAWSISKHALLWSHALSAPFGKFADGSGREMGIDCSTLVPGKQSVVVRAGKQKVELALADGAVR